jgi:hypothetical protein
MMAGSAGPPALAQAVPGAATISFRALSADGQLITDLKAADVSLKIDNTPREVKSLDFVPLGKADGSVATVAAPSVPPPFSTNVADATGPAGRGLMVLVDEESIAPGKEQTIRDAVGQILNGFGPSDRLAVVSLRQGGPRTALTTDREQIKKGLAALGGYAASRETPNDLRCRTLRLVQNVQAVFAAQTMGASGTVALFSNAVAAFQPGQTARIGQATGSDLCELRTEHFTQLATAVHASRSNFYVIEVVDASAGPSLPEAAGGLENLAGVTSGDMMRISTNLEIQMGRLLRETAGYYVVSFDDTARNTQNRRVDLSITRPDVAVRAPKELAGARGAAADKKAGTTSPRDMIRSPNAFTDLPLRAVAFSSRNTDKKIKILAMFEPIDGASKITGAMIGMFDKAGKLQAQWTAQGSDLNGPLVIAALLVEPGTYRMRVAATDANGRSGSVDSDVSANIVAAGPIHLGDLVLGKLGAQSPVPALQFTNEPEAIAMIELYGRPAGPLTAYVEITTGGEGEPLQAVPLQPSATNEPDRFILSAKLPLTSLKPGDYLVRAVVGVQGQEGKATRTLRKVGS